MTYFICSRRRWWHPILEFVLLLLFSAVFLGLSLGALAGISALLGDSGFVGRGFAESMDMYQLEVFVCGMLFLAVLAPAALLSARIVRRHRWRTLLSVTGSFSWRYLGFGSIVVLALAVLVSIVVAAVEPAGEVHLDVGLLLACFLLVPLQSVAEELVFRGILGQAIGAWTRSPIAAILIPMPLFVFGHDYSPLGLVAIAWFALCAGFLAHRTGSLAAPMALHIGNNLGFVTFGVLGLQDLNQTEMGILVSVADVIFVSVATIVLLQLHRRMTATRALTAHGSLELNGQLV
ncbi:CPBP family intramembrane glutamic endopeptidase [Corynebacterium sp. H128]|uniref:CPBP family intramembrane glutamic endopeptidase n=1 Tax=Corynebacterium sp. H128 TaxID=3133427 RepID=UPI00309A5A10